MEENLEVGNQHESEFGEDVNENNPNKTFIPQVVDDYKPKVGQEFKSLNDVREFYYNYARKARFSIRSHSSTKNKVSEEILRKEYVCFKEGIYTKKIGSGSKRRRGIVRKGCKAKIAVKKSKNGTKYIISQFVEEHNHDWTSPRKVHLLRSHRMVSQVKKSLAQQLGSVNIPKHQQFSLFEVQAGGMENVGCTQKDMYNYERDLRKEMKGHDAKMLLEHFVGEQAKNGSFFFKMESDGDDRLIHCFWADATSRRAYHFYGDVIVFDTTYNTNRYGMIFAPFVGANNYGQTIILACAFLSKETTQSFIWLFEQFKKAMPADPSKVIITDQDPAITKAISQAFPHTYHKYCIWHIVNKFSEKLNVSVPSEGYKELHKCIWDSDTQEEFDSKWMDIIDKRKIKENVWLTSIYDLRSRWVPAYVKHVFSAGMSSSQRVESCHSFFKDYVSRWNSLMDFVLRFGRALARQRHNELVADHVDINEKPILKLPMRMEKQMVGIYTRTIFYKFQDELWEIFRCVLELIREDENLNVYKAMERTSDRRVKMREVVYDKALDYVSCSCKKFEFEGIPCRHMLTLFLIKQVEKLPNKYILKRWTRAAKSGIVLEENGVEINDGGDNALLMWQAKLSNIASKLIDSASI